MNILRVKRKALELLERVEEDGAYVHLLLRQEADSSTLAADEYPLLVQLVRGVLEQGPVVDLTLEPLLPKGLKSLPKPVVHTLRLATYQILFLERAKKRDVVFEAVEITKSGPFRGLAKLVNAVLRKIEPPSEAGSSSGLAARTFPEWLITRWSEQFGSEEVERFCAATNQTLPLYVRVNTLRTTREELRDILRKEGVASDIVEFSRHSLRVTTLPRSVRIHRLASYERGLFFVQDLSSTVVSDIVAAETPQHVADLCAAPGGKTCSIALSIAPYGGTVHACDKTASRVGLISQAVDRLGLTNVVVEQRDALVDEPERSGFFDAVLLDAPCSGFGTVGRKIDARWSKSAETIQELVGIQSSMLSCATRLVKPRGILVYSTCTIDRAENEEVVEAFLASHPEFRNEGLSSRISSELHTSEGFYRAWPHRHSMAGAFAAMLRRM